MDAQYKKIKIVGRGAHGVAMLCRRLSDSSLVVIKELFEKEMSEADKKAYMNEIQVLSMFRHPNIISYYDSFAADESSVDEKGSFMIVMEYADGGTLYDFITQLKSYMQERDALYLFCQIAMALHHVHSHNILHRDLKTANVLISGSGPGKVLKLADFGISKLLTTKSKAETIVGTPSYLSPELCEGKTYNKASDIWALGCCLAELVCLKRFFDASNLPALVMKIMRGAHETIPEYVSQNLRVLIESMVRHEPEKRPSMDEIICQPFLQQHLIETQMRIGRVNPPNFDWESDSLRESYIETL